MRLEKTPIYYTQPLAKAYLLNFARVGHLYEYNPYDEESFWQRYQHLKQNPLQHRKILVDSLRAYNRQAGAGEKTFASIEALAHPDSTVVLTGQQAGIFTGPLYTIYKAIGICLLAEKWSKQLEKPVIPIFWVGEEDHDFSEINHVNVPTAEGPVKLQLNWRPEQKLSVGYTPLPDEINGLIEKLYEILPPTPHRDEIFTILSNTARMSKTPGEWFTRLMTWLFSKHGLVLASPLLVQFRRLSTDIFKDALKHTDAISSALAETELYIRQLGYSPQIKVEDERAHLFIYRQGERFALFHTADGFATRDGKSKWAAREIFELIQRKPEQFSPNVVLRPAVQDMLFPVLAYIAGPGEISYYGQLRNVYKALGRRMPIIYPRPNITMVEPLMARYLTKYSLTVENILVNYSDYSRQVIGAMDGIDVKNIFRDFRYNITRQYKDLVDSISAIDPTLKQLADSNLHRVVHQITFMENKVRQRQRQRHETALRQLKRTADNLIPESAWQERVYTIFPYLVKYPDLIERLYDLPLLKGVEHKVIYL